MSINLTLKSLERLEHLEQLHRTKSIGVLGSDLDDKLEALENVDTDASCIQAMDCSVVRRLK